MPAHATAVRSVRGGDDGRARPQSRGARTHPAFDHAGPGPHARPPCARRARLGLDFELVLTGTRLDFYESELDLAVREGALDDSSLVARSLGAARVFLCAAPAYLGSRAPIRSVEDLEKHDLLLVPAAEAIGDRPPLRGRGGRRLALHARFRANDLFAVRDLAEAGAGIAPLPDYVADEALAAGRLVRVMPRLTIAEIPIHAVYPSRRHLPRRVSVVLDALTGAFARA